MNSQTGKNIYKNLFKPIQLGSQELKNRICMAPLKRCRADPKTSAPDNLHIEYYGQRAQNAGLIITECTGVSEMGLAEKRTPGIFTDEQIAGWKKVTDTVRYVNGVIFTQIWHAGRWGSGIDGKLPLTPTKVPVRTAYNAETNSYTTDPTPDEITEEGILQVVEEFRKAAENADKAGFHGVEVHAANGYILDGFLRDGTNKREDKYGGSIENRCRFPLMVVDACIDVLGSDRVGIKITPCGRIMDMFDSDPLPLYTYLLKELEKRKIAFVELVQPPEFAPCTNFYKIEGEEQIPDVFKAFRPFYSGVLIGNNHLPFEKADKYIDEGLIDMVSYGRLFISNPDLPDRILNNYPIEEVDPKYFFSAGEEGYTTYKNYTKF